MLLVLETGRQITTPKIKDRQAKCLMSFSSYNTWLPRPPARPLNPPQTLYLFQPIKPSLPYLPFSLGFAFWETIN